MVFKSRVRFCLVLSLLTVALLVFVGAASASDWKPCGIVEDSKGGVFVLRNGKWTPVALGSALHEYESFTTNADGYAALRFDDDSRVELGPNTLVHTTFSIFTPERAMFQLHTDKGEVRIRTGAIGLKNPRGIKIVTPKNIFIASNCVANFLVAPEQEVATVEWMPAGFGLLVINSNSKREYRMTKAGDEMTTDAQNNILINTR